MELSLIRSLMNKEFYDDHRGAKCPNRLFSKDVREIKNTIDTAMDRYERTLTPDEVEALFMSDNPTMTTARKDAFSSLFYKIKKESPMGGDVAQEVLSKLFQQVVGEDIANLGVDYVTGDQSSLSLCVICLSNTVTTSPRTSVLSGMTSTSKPCLTAMTLRHGGHSTYPASHARSKA